MNSLIACALALVGLLAPSWAYCQHTPHLEKDKKTVSNFYYYCLFNCDTNVVSSDGLLSSIRTHNFITGLHTLIELTDIKNGESRTFDRLAAILASIIRLVELRVVYHLPVPVKKINTFSYISIHHHTSLCLHLIPPCQMTQANNYVISFSVIQLKIYLQLCLICHSAHRISYMTAGHKHHEETARQEQTDANVWVKIPKFPLFSHCTGILCFDLFILHFSMQVMQ